MLFDRVERHQVVAIRLSNSPAASSRSTSSSQPVSGSARSGDGSPPWQRGVCRAAGVHKRGQVAGVDAASRVLLARLGSRQPSQQGAHRHWHLPGWHAARLRSRRAGVGLGSS